MKKLISLHLVQSLLILVPVFFVACSEPGKQKASEKQMQQPVVSPRMTVLADLPDSSKPNEIFLKKMPPPMTVAVPVKPRNNFSKQAADGHIVQLLPPLTHSFVDTLTHLAVEADAQGKGFFTTYNTDNGLALDQIYCSFKDANGNLWFGTSGGGVSKYDGKDFINYTTAHGLANNIVWAITADQTGNLWFGTDGSGASKYDGKSFTNYTTAQGLANDVVLSIAKDKKGNLWFGTLAGVSKYDGHKFTSYTTAQGLVNGAVRAITVDHPGNIWFGAVAGISKYDGQSFTNYNRASGLVNDTIRSILQDKTGNLWFGTNGGGVSKFDGEKFINYSTAQGLANNVVYSIKEDKTGNIWFGTNGGGVSKFDGRKFSNYSFSQGLANNIVRSITEDETGYLWFGTFGGGVSKYGGKSFTSYTTTEGLSNSVVYSIANDKSGNLWFATFGGGVCKYDGSSITSYTTKQGLFSNRVYCVANDSKNNLWFGSLGSGVCMYNGKNFTTYSTVQGLANNTVFNILQDKTGNFWFGTSGGVSKYDGEKFTNYTTLQGLASNEVFTIFEDTKGSLWFGTSGGGVTQYDGISFVNYTTDQGLADNTVWAITEDNDNNLWFGTQQGLSMIRRGALARLSESKKNATTFSGNLFESFTTKDGLPDNFITQVVKTNDQKLYVGTNLGICEFFPVSTGSEMGKKWTAGKVFNAVTGYPVKDVNAGANAMFMDSTGIIWIGTGSDRTGLVRFDPKSLATSGQKFPPLVLQRIKINNENICWNDLSASHASNKLDSNETAPNITEEVNTFGRALTNIERDSLRKKFESISFDSITRWYPIPAKLVLPHRFNNISFDFNAIETGKHNQVKYQYILEGYDKNWSPPDNKTSAVFGNIYEGVYVFKLKVQNAEGVWSEPISYSFKVLPPWWRTWWMYLAYAIIITTIGALSFQWNHRRIIRQKKILEHKVAVATKQITKEKEIVEAQKRQIETTLKDLRATQSQLIQSEKMASLGELTAGIAHEIQNPLNFVNNFSEVNKELLEEMKDEIDKGNLDEVKEIANDVIENQEKINHHGKRADAIVKGMLQHSRSSSGVKELTDINALADEYLRLAYHGLRAKDNSFNATLKTDYDEGIGNINIIPQDIGRVILNLITNAFYAVDEKKKIPFSPKGVKEETPDLYEPVITVTTKRIYSPTGDGGIMISVADNGYGIPKKVFDKIFQPFFTTKPAGEGTGLGLSLSYDIVKAHGGEIKVETKEGEGTEFIIQLPG